MKATVYKSTGSWYIVKDNNGVFHNARVKGKFKIENISSTNPIAVGDFVNIENEDDAESVVITEILSRSNYIIRSSPHNRKQFHIVASNMDQTLLFATLRDPKTSTGFIDRFLIMAEAYHIPAIIVFNKTDLLKERDKIKLDQIMRRYQKIGYRIMATSIQQNQGMEEVLQLLQDKVTLISGHSGVGKSTFINHLFPGYQLRTSEVSDWSGKGMHTTTFAEMFDLPFGGKIIDTPGIRELGLVDISRQELSHYFPEMRSLLNQCQFNNCTHINEPGCAIKNAVAENDIDAERYISYLSMYDSIEEKNY
jgi:ribosome biogenesis GTPase